MFVRVCYIYGIPIYQLTHLNKEVCPRASLEVQLFPAAPRSVLTTVNSPGWQSLRAGLPAPRPALEAVSSFINTDKVHAKLHVFCLLHIHVKRNEREPNKTSESMNVNITKQGSEGHRKSHQSSKKKLIKTNLYRYQLTYIKHERWQMVIVLIVTIRFLIDKSLHTVDRLLLQGRSCRPECKWRQ